MLISPEEFLLWTQLNLNEYKFIMCPWDIEYYYLKYIRNMVIFHIQTNYDFKCSLYVFGKFGELWFSYGSRARNFIHMQIAFKCNLSYNCTFIVIFFLLLIPRINLRITNLIFVPRRNLVVHIKIYTLIPSYSRYKVLSISFTCTFLCIYSSMLNAHVEWNIE